MQTPKFLQELISSPEHGENTCDDCLGNDGTVYENKEGIPDIPVHPNCRCWAEEIELDKNGKKIDSKVYKGQKPETQKASDMKFEQAYNKLQEPEGAIQTVKTKLMMNQPTWELNKARWTDIPTSIQRKNFQLM